MYVTLAFSYVRRFFGLGGHILEPAVLVNLSDQTTTAENAEGSRHSCLINEIASYDSTKLLPKFN